MGLLDHMAKRSTWLQKHLNQAMDMPALSYDEICKIDTTGLYFIYNELEDGELEFQYIGQTTRSTKRMRELATDFRSHSFNRKLLAQRFREINMEIHVLPNNIKKKLIEEKIMTNEDFKSHQQFVNKTIRSSFRFKFYEYKYTDILAFEHFAIAILLPLYND